MEPCLQPRESLRFEMAQTVGSKNKVQNGGGDLKVWFILAIDFYAGIAYEIPLGGRSRRHSQHRIEGFLHFCCCDWYKQMFF